MAKPTTPTGPGTSSSTVTSDTPVTGGPTETPIDTPVSDSGAIDKGGDPWVDAPQEDQTTPISDQPTGTEPHDLPAYGDSTNLKTDRVFKQGEPDMNAVADTSYTAQGNQYPQSQASKENEARAVRAEAQALQSQADAAFARADAMDERVNEGKAESEKAESEKEAV